MVGLLIAYRLSSVKAVLCRDCGLHEYHRKQRASLKLGWWHVGGFTVPIMLLINRIRARRITRLGPAQPLVNATRKHPDPLDPGPALVSLPLILCLTFIGIPFLLFVVLLFTT
ncbi:hypothetical protein GCM10023322_38280 [Rugosimonospora acidiphila]|uniref:Uncharacterized protein n=1 Tax=Rugosimonospora acidiphila TaxID=556531 RepID=A0ABP9RX65_9ACTN